MFSSEFQDAPINFPGVNDPFVDALADRAVQSEDLAEIQAIGRLFDRHMRNQHYATMFWHSAESRVLYWDKFALPRDMDIRAPLHGSEASGWWFDADLVGSFDARFNALR